MPVAEVDKRKGTDDSLVDSLTEPGERVVDGVLEDLVRKVFVPRLRCEGRALPKFTDCEREA